MAALTDEIGAPQNHAFAAVAVGDYDNDGDIDMFLTTNGETPHQLYRNRGDGTFAPMCVRLRRLLTPQKVCVVQMSISSIMTTTVFWICGLSVTERSK